jgi:SAM-dependent methyltransferase
MAARLAKDWKTFGLYTGMGLLALLVGWGEYGTAPMDESFLRLIVALPLGVLMLVAVMNPGLALSIGPIRRLLERHTDDIDAIPAARVTVAIVLASALALYVELMIIRLHSSYFQLFAYFKNVSLLSCFLGLGIGFARGNQRPLLTPLVMPLVALQVIFMTLLRFSLMAGSLQSPIAEQFTFGIGQAEGIGANLIVYGFLALIFVFNAQIFVPLGHLASRLMRRRPKLAAYSWNLVGSLLGILAFSVVSFLWSPPVVWLATAGVALTVFFWRDVRGLAIVGVSLVVITVVVAAPQKLNRFDVFSPYQILTLVLSKEEPPVVETSNAYYQRILNLSDRATAGNAVLASWADYYGLPYLFKPRPERVLIVGSGTGNDVAAALRHDAGQVDAVEIDPAILQFGQQLHPEAPYQASNVNAIVNDARAFIRQTSQRYDLIVYGLLDSHTLLSGRTGGIRLDSYVYTVEGLREARQRLTDGGMISLTFSVLSQDLGRKLYYMLQDAFDGQPPLAYQSGYDGGYTFLAGEGLSQRPPPVTGELRDITAGLVGDGSYVDRSTDDWPFFYMPERRYPLSYLAVIAMLLVLSVLVVRQLMPLSSAGFSLPCFFLGAGFMLLETKGITELALAFGSTWIVNSVVITALLIMGFLANLAVTRWGNPRPVLTYLLLFLALVAGLAMTFADLNGWPMTASQLVLTVVLTLPFLFSGVVFSTELARSSSVAAALSANLLGAMLGGLLEYNSMYFGFRSLYVFALVLYGLALLSSLRFGHGSTLST